MALGRTAWGQRHSPEQQLRSSQFWPIYQQSAANPPPLKPRSGLAFMRILHRLDRADLRPQLPQELPRCVVVRRALWQQSPELLAYPGRV